MYVCTCVCVPGCTVLQRSLHQSLSVALGVVCGVQVDHLQLCQVTAAAARLLPNHHLQHNKPASVWEVANSQSQVSSQHPAQMDILLSLHAVQHGAV